ncbi:MAG: GGDEF domain-containing protein [Patescibacteria group bacterium]|nr:GGDEF domain-containing protein [Patescibacteria group bacterium]
MSEPESSSKIQSPNITKPEEQVSSIPNVQLEKRTKYSQQVIEYMQDLGISEKAARKLVARDLMIERLKNQRDKYKDIALHDTLTRLKRRDIAIPDIERQIDLFKNGQINTIIIGMADIDYFSRWNDLFRSHKLGDQGLIGFAQILNEVMRSEDMISRFGGEEFVIRLSVEKNMTPEEANELARGKGIELGKKVMQELLDRVLIDNILDGQRKIPIDKWDQNGARLHEREGTVVLREYARNLIEMRSRENGVEEVVMKGKGSNEEKDELCRIINSIDLSYYEEYLADERSIDEFDINDPNSEDTKALIRRRELEKMLVDDIRKVLRQSTCSTGFLVITPQDRNQIKSAEQLKGIADRLMYLAKSSGRNRVAIQTGIIQGEEPEIISIH